MPSDFQTVTSTGYVADSWSEEPFNANYLQRGFISSYAQHSYQEDFAEMMSIYITNDAATWQAYLDEAGKDGATLILLKLDYVRDYLLSGFNIDIDELRDVVQRRQNDIASGRIDLSDLTVQ